jgi:hypothetical protein
VRGCTDADTLPKPPRRDRKEAYLTHLETAGADVLLVSRAAAAPAKTSAVRLQHFAQCDDW